MSLKKIWVNRKAILEGIMNNVFKREEIEAVAAARLEICKACPFIDLEGDKCMVPGTQPCCSKCGCSLGLKTRSLSSPCGDEENPRWGAVLEEHEEWDLYQKIGYDPSKGE